MSELARRSPVAYSAIFSLTAISMTLLVVRPRVLSQRTGRCTMPGSLPDIILLGGGAQLAGALRRARRGAWRAGERGGLTGVVMPDV